MEKFPADAVDMIRQYYDSLPARVSAVKGRLGRSMTLAEKILFAHWQADGGSLPERGVSTVQLQPDRVAMQDATAQMAILQFMTAGKDQVAVPSTVHCDHLIRAKVGSETDLAVAENTNLEVYDFLATAADLRQRARVGRSDVDHLNHGSHSPAKRSATLDLLVAPPRRDGRTGPYDGRASRRTPIPCPQEQGNV